MERGRAGRQDIEAEFLPRVVTESVGSLAGISRGVLPPLDVMGDGIR